MIAPASTGLPPLLLGAAALFWGWQTGNVAAGAALGALLEAPRWISFRLELSDADYRRIADFCAVLLAAVVALLFVNRGAAPGVLSSLRWLPVVLAPLYLAQRIGPGMRASALFLYVRQQLRRDAAYPDPRIDLGGPYLAALIIGAGTANVRNEGYFLGLVGLCAWALFALRPRAAPLAASLALLAAAAGAGYAGQAGLHRLQGLVEGWVEDWLVVLPNDAERTRTQIGAIGRMKQHDTVALRMSAKPSDPARPRLLHLASFNEYRGTSWIAREPPAAQAGASEAGGSIAGEALHRVSIVLRAQGGRAVLPLPAATVEILGLADGKVRRNPLGSVLTDAPKGWLRYEAAYLGGAAADAPAQYAAPGPQDLAVPAAERPALEQALKHLALDATAPVQAIERLEKHFSAFAYSTWRKTAPAAGKTALEDFLTDGRTGHCEYFAAATTLLLRAAGIPARYATGYAAIEYSDLEEAWVLRARHAHAWTRAYVDGRWVDVDLTPPTWAEAEAALAPPWESLLDILRWAAFRWTTRAETALSPLWWVAAALLAILLGATLLRRRRAVRLRAPAAAAARRWAGADSEFYELEKALAAGFRPREPHEPLGAWFAALQAHLPRDRRSQVAALLELHQRYRFDPLGLGKDEREALRAAGHAP